MSTFSITGNFQTRFLETALLLQALDEVRGVPTTHGLDLKECAGAHRAQLLKRKFLDSFAFICASHKGGDSVSAACMEENQPTGATIRIACNSGVKDTVLSNARGIVALLSNMARGGSFLVLICQLRFND
jgi:hypothetical protein